MNPTLRLTPSNRQRAIQWIDRAIALGKAAGAWTMDLREPKRTNDQNAALWSLLSQIQRQRPTHNGVGMSPDLWKAVFLDALGEEVTFIPKLEGAGMFPIGHRSSQLSKARFSEVLELILAWAAREGLEIRHFDGDAAREDAGESPASAAA